MSQPQPESIPATCDAHPAAVYENAYPEMMPPYQRLNPHVDMHYSLPVSGGHGSSQNACEYASSSSSSHEFFGAHEHDDTLSWIAKDGVINLHCTRQLNKLA